jgi:hypothetical protein
MNFRSYWLACKAAAASLLFVVLLGFQQCCHLLGNAGAPATCELAPVPAPPVVRFTGLSWPDLDRKRLPASHHLRPRSSGAAAPGRLVASRPVASL